MFATSGAFKGRGLYYFSKLEVFGMEKDSENTVGMRGSIFYWIVIEMYVYVRKEGEDKQIF